MSATKQLILSLRLFQNEQKQVNTTKFTYKKKTKTKKLNKSCFQAQHIENEFKYKHIIFHSNAENVLIFLTKSTRSVCDPYPLYSKSYTYCNYNQKFSLEKLNLYFMQVDLIILPSCGAPQKKTLTFPFFSLEILLKI